MITTTSRALKRRKRVPVNGLIDADLGPAQTIENCRAVIEFVRQSDFYDSNEQVDMGAFLVLLLINDALEHAQNTLR